MSNRIRYSLGQSAHGDFIAAMSDAGLVVFEFTSGADSAVDSLLRRFPDANLEEDSAGLATTVATLSQLVVNPKASMPPGVSAESTAPTLGIVASINRIVRKDGSLAGGRACMASVHAANRRILPSVPKFL
jgi:hypothetical protein